jgi:DNA uptake protein ComE-like DNA-binding protein
MFSADRIISGRPYASRQELVDRGIIGKTTLEELERQFGSQKKRA